VGKFRGWHIVAGIAAMVLTACLGTAMGLNNTAAFMASCVSFVAVSKGMDSYLARRRRDVDLRPSERNPDPRGAGRGPWEDSAMAVESDNRESDGGA
jgi:hypothetical protein